MRDIMNPGLPITGNCAWPGGAVVSRWVGSFVVVPALYGGVTVDTGTRQSRGRSLGTWARRCRTLWSDYGVVDCLAGPGRAAGRRRAHDDNTGFRAVGRRGGGGGHRRWRRPGIALPDRRLRRRGGGRSWRGAAAGRAPHPAASAAADRNVRPGRAACHGDRGGHAACWPGAHRRRGLVGTLLR